MISFGAEAAHKVFANLGVHRHVHVPVGAVVDVADAFQVERTDGHLFRVDLVCEQAAADLACALQEAKDEGKRDHIINLN